MTRPVAMQIADPLPHRYLTEDEGIGGRIKSRPEDFVVEEIPLYEPSGEGEHLYLRVRKRGVSHAELLSCIRRQFGVHERAIGYAGMKDKHALTSQTVSVHVRDDPPSVEIDHDRIDVLWAERHRNKIKRGHLRGNRFSIRIRDVDPVRAPAAARTLGRLARTGAPGYFGEQRFGYRRCNHRLGAMVICGDWEGALAELLGARHSPFPEYQRERRELFDEGRYEEAAAQWTTADRAERIAATALARGRRPAEAINAVGRTMLTFWASALTSAAFNRVLDRRIDDGTTGALAEGDVAWKHENRACFRVGANDVASGALPPRLDRLEISPTGPLWGDGMIEAAGPTAEIEREALEATGVDPESLRTSPHRPEGGRRPFRVPLLNHDVEGGFDDDGPYVRVAFDLPAGMYATVVMREVMKGGNEGKSD